MWEEEGGGESWLNCKINKNEGKLVYRLGMVITTHTGVLKYGEVDNYLFDLAKANPK